MNTFKTCTKCGDTKPLTAFYRQKDCAYGRAAECKACRNAYKQTWYALHREQQRAYSKHYYQNNKQRCLTYSHRYRKTNKEKFVHYQRSYRDRILQKVLKYDLELGIEMIAILVKAPVREVELAINKIKKIRE